MGSVIGAGIGAAGSIIGGKQSAKAAKQAAQIQAAAADRAGERALTGYRYLTEGAGAAPMRGYIDAGQRALGNQGQTQNLMMDLLGITGYANNGGGGPNPAPTPAPAASNALGDAGQRVNGGWLVPYSGIPVQQSANAFSSYYNPSVIGGAPTQAQQPYLTYPGAQ